MDEPLDLLPPLVPHNSSVRLVLILRPCYSWRLKVAVVSDRQARGYERLGDGLEVKSQ
jgi:hypothetical protein